MNMISIKIYIVLAAALYANASPTEQLTVTPPIFTGGGGLSNGESAAAILEEGTCQDRSSINSGGYYNYCKKYRKCLPDGADGMNEQLVYFRSSLVTKHLPDVPLSLLTSFGPIDELINTQFYWQAQETSSTECKETGGFFWCTMLYPFCYEAPAGMGTKGIAVFPCRSICEKAKSACKTSFPELVDVIDCNDFPTNGSCIPEVNCPLLTPTTTTTSSSSTSTRTTSTNTTTSAATSSSSTTTKTTTTTSTSTSTNTITTAATPSPTTTPPACPPNTQPDASSDAECDGKKIRAKYSKNVVTKNEYGFLAYVELLAKFVENHRYAYNVTIINNYDAHCNISDHFSCGRNVTVYSPETSDCGCIAKNFHYNPNGANKYVIAGKVYNNQWVLDSNAIRCIVSTDTKNNDLRKLKKNIGKYCGPVANTLRRNICSSK